MGDIQGGSIKTISATVQDKIKRISSKYPEFKKIKIRLEFCVAFNDS